MALPSQNLGRSFSAAAQPDKIAIIDLRDEARALVVGIVELGEAVGELAAVDEQLEAIAEGRIAIAPASERADRERELRQECGLDELGFGGLFEQEVPEVAGPDPPRQS